MSRSKNARKGSRNRWPRSLGSCMTKRDGSLAQKTARARALVAYRKWDGMLPTKEAFSKRFDAWNYD